MLSAALRGRLKLQRNATPRHHRQLRGLGLDSDARMCPLCSRENPASESHFNRPLELFCRQHDVLLIDRCPMCDKGIKNRQYLSGKCDVCLHSLASASAIETPEWVHKFSSLFSPQVFWDESPAFLEVEFATAHLLLRPPTARTLSQPWLRKDDLSMIEDVIRDWPDPYLKAVQHALESGNSQLIENHLVGGSSAAIQLLALVGAHMSHDKSYQTQAQQILQSDHQKIQKIVAIECNRTAYRSKLKAILPLESSFYNLLCTGFIFRPEGVMLRASPLELAEELIAISDELRGIARRELPTRSTTSIATLLRLAHRRPIKECPPGCETCSGMSRDSPPTSNGMHEALGCWAAAFVKSIFQRDTICYGTGSQRGLFDGLSIPKNTVHAFFGPLKTVSKCAD